MRLRVDSRAQSGRGRHTPDRASPSATRLRIGGYSEVTDKGGVEAHLRRREVEVPRNDGLDACLNGSFHLPSSLPHECQGNVNERGKPCDPPAPRGVAVMKPSGTRTDAQNQLLTRRSISRPATRRLSRRTDGATLNNPPRRTPPLRSRGPQVPCTFSPPFALVHVDQRHHIFPCGREINPAPSCLFDIERFGHLRELLFVQCARSAKDAKLLRRDNPVA